MEELKCFRREKREMLFKLKDEEMILDNFNEIIYEIICDFDNFRGERIGLKFRKGKDEEIVFYYDLEDKKFVLDCSKLGKLCIEEYGVVRKCVMDCKKLKF